MKITINHYCSAVETSLGVYKIMITPEVFLNKEGNLVQDEVKLENGVFYKTPQNTLINSSHIITASAPELMFWDEIEYSIEKSMDGSFIVVSDNKILMRVK